MLPAASVEPLTVHIAGCARCEETVVELAAASAVKLVGPLQAAVVEQPFVDESECVEVVELLRRQGPFVDDTSAASGAGSTADALLNLPATTRSQLVELVATLGLATADDIAAAVASLPEAERTADDATSAQALAANLVTAGKLTDYQAAAILRGRGKSLVFGEYILVERCGSGGMGHVFRARHRRMNRVVALKVMSTAALRSADALKRFEREARAAAKLIHPHIVHAYDAGTQDGVPYLVMEYVAGSDLATILKRDGKLDIKRACDYLAQAARGLVFAHEQGIVHRDIKPGNLLVSETGGVVKVLDLGLARFQEPSVGQALPAGELTNSGALMGTVDYMAPEQALNTSRADAKADVYSLGCTLFRVLTGESVFAGETMMEKLVAHREQTPRRLRTLRPDAPQELDELVAAMLAKQPSARPAMIDVAMQLMTLADGDDDAATTLRRVPPRKKRRVIVGAGLGLAVLAVIVSIIWLRGRGPTTADQDGDGTPPSRPAPIVRKADTALNNLYVYGDPFDAASPTIEVPSLRFDKPAPLTIEAWIVAEPTESVSALAKIPYIPQEGYPTFFQFSGSGGKPQARARWTVRRDGSQRQTFILGCRTIHLGEGPYKGTSGNTDELLGGEETTELHHIALCITPLADGQQRVTKWYDGVHISAVAEVGTLVFDAQQVFNSSGFIDELRVSNSVRYKENFTPKRRFEPDAETLALFHCDEGSGNLLVDASGHERHGKLTNARWASTAKYRVAAPRPPPRKFDPASQPPEWNQTGTGPAKPSTFTSTPAFAPNPAALPVPIANIPDSPQPKFKPGTNLYIYADRYIPNRPVIEVPSLRFDASPQLTVEAWIVPEMSFAVRALLMQRVFEEQVPSFFEFWGGKLPQLRATWELVPESMELRRFYLGHKHLTEVLKPGAMPGDKAPLYTRAMLGSETSTRIHHVAVCYGATVDGKQVVSKWWDGVQVPYTGEPAEIERDPLDTFRSHGFVDEIRVSSTARYTADFAPKRRFEPDAETLALYHCDEGSGDVLVDASGHGRDGKLNGARWASTAPFPIAASGAGSNEDFGPPPKPGDNMYIYPAPYDPNVPAIEVDALTYDGKSPWTIEAWIVGEPPETVQQFMHLNWDPRKFPAFFEMAGSDDPLLRVFWSSNNTGFGDRPYGSAVRVVTPPTSNRRVGYIDNPMGVGKTRAVHHAAITFGNTVEGRTYVARWWNGYLVRYSSGRLPISFDPRDHFRSGGNIDELRISKGLRYSTSFTPERRFDADEDTIALYHCDEGSGDVLVDSSGNNRHGRLKNVKWGATSRFPMAERTPPTILQPHDPAQFVGGAAPNMPTEIEIITVPAQISLQSSRMSFIRFRNPSKQPVPLYTQDVQPLSRGVAGLTMTIEFLDGPPKTTPLRLTKTSDPKVFVVHKDFSVRSDRMELVPGESETLQISPPTNELPLGRYRARIFIQPMGGVLGRDHQATFDFSIVERGADLPLSTVEWKWDNFDPIPK